MYPTQPPVKHGGIASHVAGLHVRLIACATPTGSSQSSSSVRVPSTWLSVTTR
eukprot:CAMPEP_0198716796 /NCGR_PEP_ID=MMETSP1471-20131121/40303_1 /TAXON_ID=41880 /ORGANISM="Pycnococcus provasolii, Strain RCC733" /LENGTH=52 /DNA_ID=CAMNT_0044477341 /DNA_START=107 /DNA_END=265 /DNA_ORIENTATION=+